MCNSHHVWQRMKLETDQRVGDSTRGELAWPGSPHRPYTSHVPPPERHRHSRQEESADHHVDETSNNKRHSPSALISLTLHAFLDQLRNLCLEKNYAENKRALKHYLKFLLPTALRQQLLDLATRESRIYTLVDVTMIIIPFCHS